MNKINSMDPKFEKMLIKTNNANILGKAEQLLKECDDSTNLISNETYCKLFLCLYEVLDITKCPPKDQRDYSRALKIQNNIIDKMLLFVENNISK
jgi:hypothetical protein